MWLFALIWGSIGVALILSLYFNCRHVISGDKNIIIGVTIPYLELKNEKVLDIKKKYKKECYIMFSIMAVAFIPSYFFKLNSNQLIYLMSWFILTIYMMKKIFIKYHKILMDLKRSNGWMLPSKREITIDTELSRVKDKIPVSILWFAPAFIISIIPIVMTIVKVNEYGSLFVVSSSSALIGNIIFLIIYKMYSRERSEVISEDSKANIAYNMVFKRMWTAGTIIAATIQSIGMIMTYLFLMNNTNSVVFIIGAFFIPMFAILFGLNYINNKIREEQGKIINSCENIIYTDNDEYWSTGIYNNPNDRSVTVEDRTGTGVTYNVGTKKGKIIYYGSLIFAAILVIAVVGNIVIIDHSTFKMNIENNIVKIKSPQYGMEFNVEDIEDVKISDEKLGGTRTNGVGASTYNLGYFNINGYGKSKLYIYFENPQYIRIKLKDNGYVFFNSKSIEETLNYYNELIRFIE